MKTLDQMIGSMSPERREKIAERTKQLIAAGASNPASPYWQPGRAGDGILRKIEPNDTLPGVWAGNKP